MRLGFNVWLETKDGVALSIWRVALLQAIADAQSISGAADRMGVHFRVAWKKIREMEDRLGTRLVIGRPGGVGGGGATLTPEAELLIRRFRTLLDGLEPHVQELAREQFPSLLEGEPPCVVQASR